MHCSCLINLIFFYYCRYTNCTCMLLFGIIPTLYLCLIKRYEPLRYRIDLLTYIYTIPTMYLHLKLDRRDRFNGRGQPFFFPGDVDLTFSNFILLIQGFIWGNLTVCAWLYIIPNERVLWVGMYIDISFI